ncbi:MAG TPA: T9SS type A sorting domain-containing protein [Bacteroidales bacterium]|nr:T9SS type A sorting domain-containing protein [Bacteroidales bacterium]
MKHRAPFFQLSVMALFLLFSSQLMAQQWPASLVGRWTFDNLNNLLDGSVGNDLVLTGTHTSVPGPSVSDLAVAISNGSYYTCNHGMNANGSGNYVNEYSILMDIKIDNPKQYHSFYQTNPTNSNDGDLFINPNSQIGISATGYSGFSIKANEWYRVVITVDLGSSIRFYVDGRMVLEGISQDIDGRFSLDPSVLFFADDNGEDNLIYVSQIALFNNCLDNNQVRLLSGFHNSIISPYLQSPTPNSIYVCWNSYYSGSTKVQYGTTQTFGQSIMGSFEDIGTSGTINRWHSVKLTGLQANTKYFYRCISGSDSSDCFNFTTPPEANNCNRPIRFLKFGDNQTYTLRSTALIDSVSVLLRNLYGINWRDSISLITNTGDITEYGTEIGRYSNEFYNPFSKLTASIPSMVSIGNHEVESPYYYQFMKYEEFSQNEEISYSFILGNNQFIFLNNNGLYNDTIQSEWLEDQLDISAQDSNIDFVFLFMHQPGISELWPDGNNNYTYNILYPILAQFPKVVMINHGHSHCYERGDFWGNNSQNQDFRTVICGGAAGDLDNWGDYTNQTDYLNVERSFDMYGFLLVEINPLTKSVSSSFYSLGNENRTRSLELMDYWNRNEMDPRPERPEVISVNTSQQNRLNFNFTSSQLDQNNLMSSQFQLIPLNGSFTLPFIDSVQHSENYYGDSGSPNYEPIQHCDPNNIFQLSLDFSNTDLNQNYLARVRFRDANLRWSDWSSTLLFSPSTINTDQYPFEKTEIQIYPNPTNGTINIINFSKIQMVIFNQIGQTVLLSEFESGENTIDLNRFEDGVYFIKIYNSNNNLCDFKKIIKISQ